MARSWRAASICSRGRPVDPNSRQRSPNPSRWASEVAPKAWRSVSGIPRLSSRDTAPSVTHSVRTEHRDTQALHAKLGELLATQGEARSDLARLDEQEPEDIVRHAAQRSELANSMGL